MPGRGGAEQARLARDGRDLLAAVQRHHPSIAEEVIRYPSVGSWAQRTLHALRGGPGRPGAEPAGLCAAAAVAAFRAGFEAEVEVLPIDGAVVLPSLGTALVDAKSVRVRISAAAAEIRWPHGRVTIPHDPHQDALGWLGLRSIRAGRLRVVIDDLDPFRMPAVNGLAPRLDARQATEWQAALQRGWRLLRAHHPDVAAQMAATITVIVPLSRPAQGQISSSTPETFGAIALSEPPDPHTCAVTFAHELQHVKLSALLDVVSLVRPDDGRQYYAPWRTDPRPIGGLLQGAYAYLGVGAFWLRERQLTAGATRARADREFALWRAGVARAIHTLQSSGQLTPVGWTFVQGMAETVRNWHKEPVPEPARLTARREAERHLARWEAANGPVPA